MIDRQAAAGLVAALPALFVAGCGGSPSGSPGGAPVAAASSPPSPRSTIQFEDVTGAWGVRFRHDRASSGRKYFVETMGAGVAFLDFNRDGRQDLLFLNGAALPGYRPPAPLHPALYRNDGGGRMTDVTREAGLQFEAYGMGIAVGDFDADGWDDLYLTSVLSPSRLYRNLGNGRFQDVTERAGVDNRGRFPSSAAWLDYDRDGDLDLYVCNYVRYRTVKDDFPCYFKPGVRSYCIPFGYEGEPDRLYRNDGNGRFTDVTGPSGIGRTRGKSLGVAIADFDRDGWPDLFIANDTTPTELFRNNGDGTFTEMAATAAIAYGPSGAAKAGMGIDIADDRNDGSFSVAMGNFSTEMVGYYQLTEGGFFEERSVEQGLGHPSRQFLTFGAVFADLDNDTWKDLVLANGHVQDNVGDFHTDLTYEQTPLLFRNMGGARYADVSRSAGAPFQRPIVARGLARGDLDDDGRIDLVITRNNGPAHVWLNRTAGAGHWLKVKLLGAGANRNGFGARVTAICSGVRQVLELQSGGSYLSQSDQRLHFGLGAATKVDRLEIRWPRGAVDVLTNLSADRQIEVKEGSAPAPEAAR